MVDVQTVCFTCGKTLGHLFAHPKIAHARATISEVRQPDLIAFFEEEGIVCPMCRITLVFAYDATSRLQSSDPSVVEVAPGEWIRLHRRDEVRSEDGRIFAPTTTRGTSRDLPVKIGQWNIVEGK